jgi:hypothetical protein
MRPIPAFPTDFSKMVSGMTLRDYFAAAIIQGIYAHSDHRQNMHPTDALEAYSMADQMLRTREALDE